MSLLPLPATITFIISLLFLIFLLVCAALHVSILVRSSSFLPESQSHLQTIILIFNCLHSSGPQLNLSDPRLYLLYLVYRSLLLRRVRSSTLLSVVDRPSLVENPSYCAVYFPHVLLCSIIYSLDLTSQFS